MYDLILFDLDGTLVDTAPEITDAVNILLRSERLGPVPESLVRKWIGHGTRELLIHALEHSTSMTREAVCDIGLIDHAMPEFSRVYLDRCGTRSVPYPGVERALDELRTRGIRLAMVTNKEERFAFAVLDKHSLRDYLDLVVCGDTLPQKKPDPAPARYCMQRFAATLARTLLVGDSEIDVATARAAGIDVWVVPYGYNHGKPIAEAQPDRVIHSIAEMVRLLAPAPSPVF